MNIQNKIEAMNKWSETFFYANIVRVYKPVMPSIDKNGETLQVSFTVRDLMDVSLIINTALVVEHRYFRISATNVFKTTVGYRLILTFSIK